MAFPCVLRSFTAGFYFERGQFAILIASNQGRMQLDATQGVSWLQFVLDNDRALMLYIKYCLWCSCLLFSRFQINEGCNMGV